MVNAQALPPIQGDLFSGTQVVRRRVDATGTTIELRLRPLGGGRVRIEEARRRSRDALQFAPWSSEAGREVLFDQLGLPMSYAELFGDLP